MKYWKKRLKLSKRTVKEEGAINSTLKIKRENEKIFELKEQQIKIIQQVMNEKPECNTEAAALRYIIESYDYEKSEAERITKIVLTSMEKSYRKDWTAWNMRLRKRKK